MLSLDTEHGMTTSCEVTGFQAAEGDYMENIANALNFLKDNKANEILIISGDGEVISANRSILGIFSSNYLPLIMDQSSSLFLPDCSASSIKHLINIIINGFTLSNAVSYKDINDIIVTAKLLDINIANLCFDINKHSIKSGTEANKTEVLKSSDFATSNFGFHLKNEEYSESFLVDVKDEPKDKKKTDQEKICDEKIIKKYVIANKKKIRHDMKINKKSWKGSFNYPIKNYTENCDNEKNKVDETKRQKRRNFTFHNSFQTKQQYETYFNENLKETYVLSKSYTIPGKKYFDRSLEPENFNQISLISPPDSTYSFFKCKFYKRRGFLRCNMAIKAVFSGEDGAVKLFTVGDINRDHQHQPDDDLPQVNNDNHYWARHPEALEVVVQGVKKNLTAKRIFMSMETLQIWPLPTRDQLNNKMAYERRKFKHLMYEQN